MHRIVVEMGCAVGVEYSHDGGAPQRAYADSEVVLCAGVLGSPKALLLTGIGPSAHLESVGVAPVVNLPGVGRTCTITRWSATCMRPRGRYRRG